MAGLEERLKDLERRLKDEPGNLGLRVIAAGAMHDAGRKDDAVELYRSVAVAYRDQGRTQQAIAVCKSILEIAPGDERCVGLLRQLTGDKTGPVPVRRSSFDETPLPGPLPYHVADPTTRSIKKLSEVELPVAEGADTRPGDEPPRRSEVSGLANAARRISAGMIGSLADEGHEEYDVIAELDTRQRPRIDSAELKKIALPPPTAPVPRIEDVDEDAMTPPPGWLDRQPAGGPDPLARDTERSVDTPPPNDTEEELTVPREAPGVAPAVAIVGTPPPPTRPRVASGSGARDITSVREPITNQSTAMLAAAFFTPLPAPRRAAVLSRFHRRIVRAGDIVIRQGDSEPSLVLVGRGKLEVRVERPDGKRVHVDTIAAGDYVGEGALLTRTPAPAHVVAATDAELLALLPHDFYEIAGAFPALWAQLKDVAERRATLLETKLR